MRKCALNNKNALLAAMAKKAKLYVPTDGADEKSKLAGAYYAEWKDGAAVSGRLNTTRSPKDFFFPQTENLMTFQMTGKKLEIFDARREHEDFILFGVRACDVRSFTVLDNVFLSDPVDTYYQNRRQHGTIVSMACTKPAETCFCRTFGIDAADPEGDVVCWEDGEYIYLTAKTEKGAELLAAVADVTEDCDDHAADGVKALANERLDKLPLADLKSDAFGGGKTDKFFNNPAWNELSEACLGCGTCTFVCPTCQCYDIKDFNTGRGVIRFRCWDSCMYSDFTMMAHGTNRPNHMQRFRQRFMHKLVYYPENNNGLFSCVGCGRCLSRCPISMNIVKVMKKLGGNENE